MLTTYARRCRAALPVLVLAFSVGGMAGLGADHAVAGDMRDAGTKDRPTLAPSSDEAIWFGADPVLDPRELVSGDWHARWPGHHCGHRDRYVVTATGQTAQEIPGASPFVGTADVQIGPAEFMHVAVTTILLGEPMELPCGSLLAQTSHTFDFGPLGGFTTMDYAVLRPTEPPCTFSLNSLLYVGPGQGTGDFEEAVGVLFAIEGEIDLCAGTASWSMVGKMQLACRPTAAPIETAMACEECPFEGVTTIHIGCRAYEAEVQTILLEPPPAPGEPATTTHTFTLLPCQRLEGSFTTIDTVYLIPCDPAEDPECIPECMFMAMETMVIDPDAGTGDFEGATGTLFANGMLNLCMGTFSGEVDGLICLNE